MKRKSNRDYKTISILLCAIIFVLLWTNIHYYNKSNEYENHIIQLERLNLKDRVERSINNLDSVDGYKTSKGYASDPDYEPTVDDNGEYHTIDGKRNQVQFQGSKEQADQLKEMEKRGW